MFFTFLFDRKAKKLINQKLTSQTFIEKLLRLLAETSITLPKASDSNKHNNNTSSNNNKKIYKKLTLPRPTSDFVFSAGLEGLANAQVCLDLRLVSNKHEQRRCLCFANQKHQNQLILFIFYLYLYLYNIDLPIKREPKQTTYLLFINMFVFFPFQVSSSVFILIS